MKEKDQLKEFIEANREAFDTATPPSIDFSNLADEKPIIETSKPIKRMNWGFIMNIAATALILIGLGTMTYHLVKPNNNTALPMVEKQATNNNVAFSFSLVSQEMAEVESYYIQQVNHKQQQVSQLGYSDEIKEELILLDEEFNALKKELGNGVDDQLIVEEMIMNYQLKLDLLETVLNNSNTAESKSSKNEHHDTNYTIYY
ncbi:MAG: hypothetical protein N4A35_02210 [Flavobacteriales bacterium]|jgi:hypothetical protein|nr:hypothetical protein [Flavobacteriales bacterium]